MPFTLNISSSLASNGISRVVSSTFGRRVILSFAD